MKRILATLLALLAPIVSSAGTTYPSGGGIQTATIAQVTAACSVVGSTLIFSTMCASASDCSTAGTVPKIVQCDGAGSYNFSPDGAAGAGDGVPAGSASEIQYRVNATDFGAVSGTSVSGGAITIGTGGSIEPSATGIIGATKLNQVAGEIDLLYNASANCAFPDVDGDGAQDTSDASAAARSITAGEACIQDLAYFNGTDNGRRIVCDPNVFDLGASDTDGIQECVDYLEDIGGGTVRLGPRNYNISGATPITITNNGDCTSGACEIVFDGAGAGATFVQCVTAGGCTATAVFSVQGSGVTFRNMGIAADRDGTAVDGVVVGSATVYPRHTVFDRVGILGDSGDWSPRGTPAGYGVLNYGLLTKFNETSIKWFDNCVRATGGAAATVSTEMKVNGGDFTFCDHGIYGTAGTHTTDVSDLRSLYVAGTVFENIFSHGIHLIGTGTATFQLPHVTVIGSRFEGLDTGIYCEGNVSAVNANDCHITSIGNLYTVMADTAEDADAEGVSIYADSNSDSVIASIGDNDTAGRCVNHQGTSGRVDYFSPIQGTGVCTPTVSSTVTLHLHNSTPQVQQDATDCTDNSGNLGDFCQELDANALYVCETSPKCSGSGWVSYGGGGGTGDSISVDGVAVTDPNFASSGVVDFVDTSNTITGNINTGGITSTHLSDNTITFTDIAADLTMADGDTLDLSAIDCDGTTCDGVITEGFKFPQHATNCSDVTGEGVACWDTDDVLYIGTGGSTIAIAAGGWTDTGTEMEQATSTDEVVIGGGGTPAAIDGAKVTIDGDTDQVQLIVSGNGTQTANLQVWEQSGGTNVAWVDNDGDMQAASFTATPSATPTMGGNDVDFDGAGLEGAMVINCPTDGDCDLAFQAKTAGTLTEAFRIDTADAGTQTVIFTAAPNIGTGGMIYANGTVSTTDFDVINDGAIQSAEIQDDTIAVADVADGDWGDFSIATNAASLDADTVGATELTTGAVAAATDLADALCTEGQILKKGAVSWACGADADTGGSTAWSAIGNAASATDVDFAGFDQDILSTEPNGNILRVINTTIDQASDSTVLTLGTYDTNDANLIFIKGINDVDGTPAIDWIVADTGTVGGLTQTWGATGVTAVTDGDGAVTFTSLGGGSGEAHNMTFNLDDTANVITWSSTTATSLDLSGFTISGADLTADTVDAAALADNSVALANMLDDSVGAAEIAINAVGTSEVNDNTLTASDLANDSVDEAELAATFTECSTLYAPTAEVADTDDITSVWKAPEAITITEVWCETNTGTVNMDVQIDDGTPADVMGADLACASTAVSDSTGLTGSMAAGDRLDWAITSVATNPTRLTVCIEYTY